MAATNANLEEKRAYYAAIATAAEMPVMVQHSWPGMSGEYIAGLIRDIDQVCYVKEETNPSGHSISAVIEAAGEGCLGVFGGAHGRWMIPEMRRGACGFIPADQFAAARAEQGVGAVIVHEGKGKLQL